MSLVTDSNWFISSGRNLSKVLFDLKFKCFLFKWINRKAVKSWIHKKHLNATILLYCTSDWKVPKFSTEHFSKREVYAFTLWISALSTIHSLPKTQWFWIFGHYSLQIKCYVAVKMLKLLHKYSRAISIQDSMFKNSRMKYNFKMVDLRCLTATIFTQTMRVIKIFIVIFFCYPQACPQIVYDFIVLCWFVIWKFPQFCKILYKLFKVFHWSF